MANHSSGRGISKDGRVAHGIVVLEYVGIQVVVSAWREDIRKAADCANMVLVTIFGFPTGDGEFLFSSFWHCKAQMWRVVNT